MFCPAVYAELKLRFDSETISTWFWSQLLCKCRQPECGRCTYPMHSTEHLLKVAHIIAACPREGQQYKVQGRARSLFPDHGQVSWADGISGSVCRAAIIFNHWFGDKNTVVALAGGERWHDRMCKEVLKHRIAFFPSIILFWSLNWVTFINTLHVNMVIETVPEQVLWWLIVFILVVAVALFHVVISWERQSLHNINHQFLTSPHSAEMEVKWNGLFLK